MEVGVNLVQRMAGALIVAVMLPLATDARVAQDLATVWHAEGRTQLATMRDVVQRHVRRL